MTGSGCRLTQQEHMASATIRTATTPALIPRNDTIQKEEQVCRSRPAMQPKTMIY